MKPAIVVVGYNRPHSIQRLLDSLDRATYDVDDIPLVVSIDHADSDENAKVVQIANEFDWKYGAKKIVTRELNLGLRNHILKCGDLTNEYGSIILLEDDLTVSPVFYAYTCASLDHFEGDDNIAGISLYNHKRNFTAALPFQPLVDGSDNYFLQIASSWGQAWTAKQWGKFRLWYDSGQSIEATDQLPEKIKQWPESSWLKYFIKYLVETNRYFSYPRTSHTTNFGDTGTHADNNSLVWQVPLCHRHNDFRLANLDSSLAVYDSFFEIDAGKLKQLAPFLSAYDFEIDQHGRKLKSSFNSEFVITCKECKDPVFTFPFQLKPLVANLLHPNSNNELGLFSLCRVSDVVGVRQLDVKTTNEIQYFLGGIDTLKVLKNAVLRKIFNK